LARVAAGVEKFLCGENTEERGFHGSFDADFLFLGFDFGELRFFGEDVAAAGEFSGSDDGLLDEETLLAAADGAAANFVAGVGDGGIRVEAGLLLARFGGADFGFGLAESGIGFDGEALCFFEGEEWGFGVFLGAAEAGGRPVGLRGCSCDGAAFGLAACSSVVGQRRGDKQPKTELQAGRHFLRDVSLVGSDSKRRGLTQRRRERRVRRRREKIYDAWRCSSGLGVW